MPVITPTQMRAFTKAAGVANDVLPQLEWLEQMAAVYPPAAEQVAMARAQRDMLAHVSDVAIAADRALSGA